MTLRTLSVALASLALAACATREPMPFAAATDCFFPICSIDVEVVDAPGGRKQLKLANDGNVRMGTRHRLVAIVWRLNTPGYEFRGDSIWPHTALGAAGTVGAERTSQGTWDRQIIALSNTFNTYSVTNQNRERLVLWYDITVYPARGTAGEPITAVRGIMNDP